MANNRTLLLIDRLLAACEEAILLGDWKVARTHAESVLALDPENDVGQKYLAASDLAVAHPLEPQTHQSVHSPGPAWQEALERYRFPVDFTQFRQANPRFFDLTISGDPASTTGFQKRFRERAPHDFDAWLEVIFWKMYGQRGRPWREVRRAEEKRGQLAPSELWNLCEEFKQAFEVDPIAAKDHLKQLTAAFFKSTSIATIWTFVSFSDEAGRFPMIDRIISDWVHDNFLELDASEPCRNLARMPKRRSTTARPVNLTLGDYDDFVVGWVRWARCMAQHVSEMTGRAWSARDVEMAIYSIATGRASVVLPVG